MRRWRSTMMLAVAGAVLAAGPARAGSFVPVAGGATIPGVARAISDNGQGRPLLAWLSPPVEQGYQSLHVWLLNDTGDGWQSLGRRIAKVNVDHYLYGPPDPALTVIGGVPYATWSIPARGSGVPQLRVFSYTGGRWHESRSLNEDPSLEALRGSFGTLDGRPVVAFEELASPTDLRIVVRALAPDGRTWVRLGSAPELEESSGATPVGADGNLWLVYNNGWTRVTRYDPATNTWSTPLNLNTLGFGNAFSAASVGGVATVAYRDESYGYYEVRRYDAESDSWPFVTDPSDSVPANGDSLTVLDDQGTPELVFNGVGGWTITEPTLPVFPFWRTLVQQMPGSNDTVAATVAGEPEITYYDTIGPAISHVLRYQP
jgi:hypothetical protein